MSPEEEKKLLETLSELHEWPCHYMYKFIVEKDQSKIEEIESVFPKASIDKRDSKTGKYTSLTIRDHSQSASVVVSKYKVVAKIEGVMKL